MNRCVCENVEMSEGDSHSEELRKIETTRTIDLSEQKSITGSAQSIGLEPSENFVAPVMALDLIEPSSDE